MRGTRLILLAISVLAAALLLSGLVSAALAKGPAQKEEKSDTVQTPFGPAKKRDVEPKKAPVSKGPSMTAVKVEGETATFSRKTPFGVQSWKRKLSELSAAEKKLLEEAEASAKPDSKAEPEKK